MPGSRRKPKRIGSGDMLKTHFGSKKQSVSGLVKKKGSHNTKAYMRARNERRKAQTRIRALERKRDALTSAQAKDKVQTQIDNLQKTVAATYMYSQDDGTRIRSREEAMGNVAILARHNLRLGSLVTSEGRANLVTGIELNRATVGRSSVYTKAQVHIFYKKTQEAWQQAGVALEDRNAAIVAEYGPKLGTSSLADIVEQVLGDEDTQKTLWAIAVFENPDNHTDAEKREAFDVLMDNGDEDTVSPRTAQSIFGKGWKNLFASVVPSSPSE